MEELQKIMELVKERARHLHFIEYGATMSLVKQKGHKTNDQKVVIWGVLKDGKRLEKIIFTHDMEIVLKEISDGNKKIKNAGTQLEIF